MNTDNIKVKAVIALGSNLDDPVTQLQNALGALGDTNGIEIIKKSSLYRTTPVGYLDQPDFVNAVALIETTLTPDQLLESLHQIENKFGRVRSFANAPRTLDLDIIDYNQEVKTSEHLTIPHPRAHERIFVVQPLAEIAPDYCLPGYGLAAELLSSMKPEGIQIIQ